MLSAIEISSPTYSRFVLSAPVSIPVAASSSAPLIKGTVAEFWYRNPHPALFINVTDEKGTATRWTIEIAPTPYTLALRGWSKKRADDALKAGTAVSVKVHAARAGTPVGLLDSITNAEGVDILGGGGAGPAR